MAYRRIAFLAVSLTATLHAQAPDPAPTFEVAVIHRLRDAPTRGWGGRLPGGNYVVPGMTVVQMVASAFGVPPDRVFGAPRWALTDLYEIHAKAPGNATGAETIRMMQSLLRDRFKLAVREELRDLPVYELRVARDDGRLGSRMRLSLIDCTAPDWQKRAEMVPPPSGLPQHCFTQVSAGRIAAGSVALDRFAPMLTGPSGRAVLNRTGLAGFFDIDVEWSSGAAADKPWIFTAVQEQLGLKLEPAIAPLAGIVVDRVERPSEN